MKVRIERHGGFAGVPAVGERSADELTPAQRTELDKLMKSPPAAPSSPDRIHPFRYTIVVTDSGGRRELEVPEDAMPDELAAIPKITLD